MEHVNPQVASCVNPCNHALSSQRKVVQAEPHAVCRRSLHTHPSIQLERDADGPAGGDGVSAPGAGARWGDYNPRTESFRSRKKGLEAGGLDAVVVGQKQQRSLSLHKDLPASCRIEGFRAQDLPMIATGWAAQEIQPTP
jgi:hypothetical protein